MTHAGQADGVNTEHLSQTQLLTAFDLHVGTPEDVIRSLSRDTILRQVIDVAFQVHPIDPPHEQTLRSIEPSAGNVAPAPACDAADQRARHLSVSFQPRRADEQIFFPLPATALTRPSLMACRSGREIMPDTSNQPPLPKHPHNPELASDPPGLRDEHDGGLQEDEDDLSLPTDDDGDEWEDDGGLSDDPIEPDDDDEGTAI
ncbi:hypothetical protein AA101099_1335 [Neoasaia chiangmaiensis NBRC 101099]|uniref:Uncharacterized protein n=1 Tax=Neoasaia chiangmaiensis TaxID=320497 RepID=A0A1U9KQF4_9PROT|nr:hypothetical protein [Neoasaia chiangmaiensis]AQS88071.1 hypothetical protein A0U93_09065 [Neoasaia chiangmaiensis]GBR38748.1 hypothetical protein AA101099_1335 [Neoasaia chiangmaiensis NBRC 101099]GEN15749.1 hypothetical protein NCH01_21800 [Neoasaia chiangmaiensis]